jgi:hypothetical protein
MLYKRSRAVCKDRTASFFSFIRCLYFAVKRAFTAKYGASRLRLARIQGEVHLFHPAQGGWKIEKLLIRLDRLVIGEAAGKRRKG